MMFVAIGVVSLTWLIPWCLLAPHLRLRQLVSHISPAALSRDPFQAGLLGHRAGTLRRQLHLVFLPDLAPLLFRERAPLLERSPGLLRQPALLGRRHFFHLRRVVADAIIRRGRNAVRVRQATVSLGLVGCCALMLPAVAIQQSKLCRFRC